MLKIIATRLGRAFKSSGLNGAWRFKVLYWAYRITGWHIRHREWDYVLDYLPKLHNDQQKVKVLDVGCSRTLFVYELANRGYGTIGIDLEDFQEDIRLGSNIAFFKRDITKPIKCLDGAVDFVTCISVLEHIGRSGAGDYMEQQRALENMLKSLKAGGRLLLTCPTKEFAMGHIWHGFSWEDIVNMLELIPIKVRIVNSTERLGQLCMCVERAK